MHNKKKPSQKHLLKSYVTLVINFVTKRNLSFNLKTISNLFIFIKIKTRLFKNLDE